MPTDIDVAIIGTGTAALAAASEARKAGKHFIIISNGVYGTTCVRAGCMPSKVLIQAAQHYAVEHICRGRYAPLNAPEWDIDVKAVLEHVRDLRAYFLSHTLKLTERFRPQIVEGAAMFRSANDIEVDGTVYHTKATVIATGSTPIVPAEYDMLGAHLLTSDTLFEQESLPDTIGVLGLSVLGTEMAQAFARLGIKVSAFDSGTLIGGLSDPVVSDYAVKHLSKEMDLHMEQVPEFALRNGKATIITPVELPIGKLFIATGRRANISGMGLEELGVVPEEGCVIDYDRETMQVKDLPIFVAGDVKLGRSVLNEALDEGKIAGYNAARGELKHFQRRTPMTITYTEPTIAVVGKRWDELDHGATLTGFASFEDHGRARIMGMPHGMLHIYADKQSQQLVGAEIFAPMGEHLAHMVAWLIDRKVTVEEALNLPFYHPSLGEGVQTAFTHLGKQLDKSAA